MEKLIEMFKKHPDGPAKEDHIARVNKRIEVLVSNALTLPEETPVETEVKVPVSSSGDRSGAKNAGVSQDNIAGRLEKTKGMSKAYEMCQATDVTSWSFSFEGGSSRQPTVKVLMKAVAAYQAANASGRVHMVHHLWHKKPLLAVALRASLVREDGLHRRRLADDCRRRIKQLGRLALAVAAAKRAAAPEVVPADAGGDEAVLPEAADNDGDIETVDEPRRRSCGSRLSRRLNLASHLAGPPVRPDQCM